MSDDKDLTLLSEPSVGTTAKASSVLQKNSKLYGPMNALDYQNATTCWNSEGSSSGKLSCSYMLDFGRVVQPLELRMQFQAGFAAEEVAVFSLIGTAWAPTVELEADDDHDMQSFPLQENKTSDAPATKAIKLVFDECTDFYGRVTIYKLQVWGHEVSATSKSVEGSAEG